MRPHIAKLDLFATRFIQSRTLVLLLAFLLYAALSASPAHADRVDDYVREQMRLRHVPGLAIAVVRDGRVIKESGYGLASVELDVPVSSSTVFEIGSISKQITAAAVMMLVEEGKVSLDDPISKYIGESPGSWRGVTVRHLLTHTSGLKNYNGLPGFELTEHLKRAEFIKRIGAYPPSFAPGEDTATGISTTAFSATLFSRCRERATGNSSPSASSSRWG